MSDQTTSQANGVSLGGRVHGNEAFNGAQFTIGDTTVRLSSANVRDVLVDAGVADPDTNTVRKAIDALVKSLQVFPKA